VGKEWEQGNSGGTRWWGQDGDRDGHREMGIGWAGEWDGHQRMEVGWAQGWGQGGHKMRMGWARGTGAAQGCSRGDGDRVGTRGWAQGDGDREMGTGRWGQGGCRDGREEMGMGWVHGSRHKKMRTGWHRGTGWAQQGAQG